MLTPQDVSEKRFKQAFMGGYDMAAVDSFLEAVTEDYTTLFKENAVLKSKIRVLVEKLEEYRSVDDSMRKALLSAQKMAEETRAEAQSEADAILNKARAEARDSLAALTDAIGLEEKRLETARTQTVGFVSSLQEIYRRQMEALAQIPLMERPEPSPRQKREAAAGRAVEEIAQSVLVTVEQTIAPPEDVPEDEDDPHTDTRVFVSEDDAASSAVERTPEELASLAAAEKLKSFEVVFSAGTLVEDEDRSDIWEPENDTEVPGPRYDHPDLDTHFGHDQTAGESKHKMHKRR